jgi:hypothetical protein
VQGIDFGDLVRERRRQRGLSLPVADKVLPFRASATPETTTGAPPPIIDDGLAVGTEPLQLHATLAEGRVAGAFAALQEAELCGASRRELECLEEAYFAEAATYEAAVANLTSPTSDAS